MSQHQEPATTIEITNPAGGRTVLRVRDGEVTSPRESVNAISETNVKMSVEGFVHPLFVDTHNHLALAARNQLGVPMNDASDIAAIVDRIRARAATTPPGEWIVTAADWHESTIAERRLPLASELDEATTAHPVLVQRGGHNGVLNTNGLHRAGITRTSEDIDGGVIERAADGNPTGAVQDEAYTAVQRLLPAVSEDDLVAAIEYTSAAYLQFGVGTVRDPAVTIPEWRAYERARRDGQLHVRTHAMLFTPAALIEESGSMASYLDQLESDGLRAGMGDDILRLWGIKLILDGGVEAAALEEPYVSRPGFSGTQLMSFDMLTEALRTCVRRGWPVGVHAVGDAAIESVLDAVQLNVDAGVQHTPGSVVIEHAALITPQQIDRVATLELHITAQQALRDSLVEPMLAEFGKERVARMFPWTSLLDAGVSVSAGTDHPISPLNPMYGLSGMITRDTRGGVLGAEYAISPAQSLELYTDAGATLLGFPAGIDAPTGCRADFAVYPIDIATASADNLHGLTPLLVVSAGRIHDFRSGWGRRVR